jgi:hypothetical protein
LSAPVELFDDALSSRLDLADLPPGPGCPGVLALRVQFDIGERTYGVPVPFGRSQLASPRPGDDASVTARADAGSMTVVQVDRPGRSALDKLRARWGRKK